VVQEPRTARSEPTLGEPANSSVRPQLRAGNSPAGLGWPHLDGLPHDQKEKISIFRPNVRHANRLHLLHDELGQSPWLDDLTRGYLTGGELSMWVAAGIRGVTSNPTIFQRAIARSADYDEQFGALTAAGHSVDEAYWEMVVDDITAALAVLRPVHDASAGADGFLSVEVAPDLAHDTAGTVAAARELHDRIAQPNLSPQSPTTERSRAVSTGTCPRRGRPWSGSASWESTSTRSAPTWRQKA
jgi:hypothetical protein